MVETTWLIALLVSMPHCPEMKLYMHTLCHTTSSSSYSTEYTSPCPTDVGLGHVTCSGQRVESGGDTNRRLRCACVTAFAV